MSRREEEEKLSPFGADAIKAIRRRNEDQHRFMIFNCCSDGERRDSNSDVPSTDRTDLNSFIVHRNFFSIFNFHYCHRDPTIWC